MNDRVTAVLADARIADVFASQQRACDLHPYPSADERRAHLRALKAQLARYQDVLADAISSDFGWRSAAESMMLDLLPTTLEINHAISHVERWMKPSRRSTEWLFASNSLHVHYQPKGVVGVIATWNFPVYLSMGPLAAALAAGNRVMIKMPDVTPATNAVLKQLLGEVFDDAQVALIDAELQDPNVFSSLPFNHIIFTGSPAVGGIVMRQAAQNLTPVTLELGGKSPALVMRGYPVREAALRSPTARAPTPARSAWRRTTRWCRASRSRNSCPRRRKRSAVSTAVTPRPAPTTRQSRASAMQSACGRCSTTRAPRVPSSPRAASRAGIARCRCTSSPVAAPTWR